jgi:hypothetical protein
MPVADDFAWIDDPPRISPRTDRLGRHNHDPKRFLHGLPGALFLAEHGPMLEVPKQFWALEVEGKGGSARDIAVVACPCGQSPTARPLGPPVECACERIYMFTGRDVQVFNSPHDAT